MQMRRYTLEDLRLQMKDVLEVHMGITPLKENLPWYHIQHPLQGHRSTMRACGYNRPFETMHD